jgi:Xaa-Pro aminopeptidase
VAHAEPGYYEDNAFGIRIENCTRIVEANTKHNFGSTKFYTFDAFTLVPIQTRIVEVSLLTDAQRKWLNDYHARVANEVAPFLSGKALAWMQRETQPI